MKTLTHTVLAGLALATALPLAQAASGRDYISIVGSSTVFPFSSSVAEHLGQSGKFKTPTVESTGTGGGFKAFCGGIGPSHPDIANASRKVKSSEIDNCASNGVKELVEIKIGFDGIVVAQAKWDNQPEFNLTPRDLYLGLAKQIPDPECQECGKLIDNPYKTWDQVNPNLPNTTIEVLGPPPTSGTRDAFSELAMEAGCKSYEWIAGWKKKNKDEYKRFCHTLRDDGAYVEAGENDNLIVQKLQTKPNAFGIFGFSFLDSNQDILTAANIEGVTPTLETIADGVYPISRPLFFYVKKAQMGQVPGLMEYIEEFTSEKAWGDEGYLIDKGLVPLPVTEREKMAESARKLKVMSSK